MALNNRPFLSLLQEEIYFSVVRQAVIEDSKKFKGLCDTQGNCISNQSGSSVGVNGDNFKAAGGRIVLADWCAENRCTPDSTTKSGYKENPDGTVIFGVRLYTQSQGLLFSGYNLGLMGLESGALLIGCTLVAIAYMRNGFAEIDVYPSQAVLQSSLTVLLVGGYLLVVGVFAQILAMMGGAGNFQSQAFLVLLGVAALAVLLLSERLRQRIGSFVSHHFQRPQHDFRKVWTLLTQRISSVMEPGPLCLASARLISETFHVLSVTIWLVEVSRSMLDASARMRRILSAKSATTRLLALRFAVSEPCALTSGRSVSTAATASIWRRRMISVTNWFCAAPRLPMRPGWAAAPSIGWTR